MRRKIRRNRVWCEHTIRHEFLVMPQHVIPEVGRISTIFHFYSACLANRFAFVKLTFVHNVSESEILPDSGFALRISGVFNARAWLTLPKWPDAFFFFFFFFWCLMAVGKKL
ncbi:hypothetical protein XENOCAPTIV_018326 [Xenoophorus captivus]|uniref:Uncharacterized protein n=1 Tax=Xenoophorus captivus TaxID=1517983 RepID=A0ABV0R2C3_9TELE